MDQRNFIKDQYRKSPNISEIARITSHSRTTIRAIINETSAPKAPFVKTRTTSASAYYPEIKALLERNATVKSRKNRLTAKRIYTLLIEKHGEIGISCRTVERFVQKAKDAIGIQQRKEFLRLASHPAEAQLDFGEIIAFVNRQQRKLAMLVISFPHSNARWGIVLPAQTFECLAYGMKRIFDIIGFVPTRIRFDNMSTAVSKVISRSEKKLPDGVYDAVNNPRVLNENFVRLMGHYGFVADFCGPAKGNEKGSVENAVGFLRRNVFCPALQVSSVEELNATYLIPACHKFLKNNHYKRTDRTIQSLFEDDRMLGLALPAGDFDPATFRKATVNNYGEVNIDTNGYPVPGARPGETVVVKLLHDTVVVCSMDGEVLAQHSRVFDRHCTIIDWERELKQLTRKPRAFRDSNFSKVLDPSVIDYLAVRSPDERRIVFEESLDALQRLASIEDVAKELRTVIELCNADDDAIELTGRWRFYAETHQYSITEQIDMPSSNRMPSMNDFPM